VIHSDQPGEVGAVTLVNGEPAELIDAHWLFASLAMTPRRSKKAPVCHLPGDDPWIHNLLRPIVEAAGYRVIGDEEEEEADLVIATKGSEAGATAPADRTIWLRADPDGEGKKDDSIYRYDRAGLLMALKSAASGRG
jgi:two-component system chemotaxis sensor kinase CheA